MFRSIQTFLYSLQSEKAKMKDMQSGFDSVFEAPIQKTSQKNWHERPVGAIAIIILGGLVVAYLAYRFGWTK